LKIIHHYHHLTIENRRLNIKNPRGLLLGGPWAHLAHPPQCYGLGLGWQAPLERDAVPGAFGNIFDAGIERVFLLGY